MKESQSRKNESGLEAFCTPDHMESELILLKLHSSQMRDCCCQCEKPELQSGYNKAIDLLPTFKTKGKSNLTLGPEPSSGYCRGRRQLLSWSKLMSIAAATVLGISTIKDPAFCSAIVSPGLSGLLSYGFPQCLFCYNLTCWHLFFLKEHCCNGAAFPFKMAWRM